MIEIDGGYGEGGGQIVRTSIGLSCLTMKPVRITNIRAKRDKPGLTNQLVTAIRVMKDLTKADVIGNEKGSRELTFTPREFTHKKLREDVGTAGSVSLILQMALIGCFNVTEEVEFELKGGTEVRWSPTIDYVKNVTLRALNEFGYEVDLKILQRGYYPEGGGKVSVMIKPKKHCLEKHFLTQPDNPQISGVCVVTGLNMEIAQRERVAIEKELKTLYRTVEITESARGTSVGTSCTLWLNNGFLGTDALGDRGKPAEDVGREAAERMNMEIKSGAAVDENLADNLVPFIALCGGSFKTSSITEHTRTNIFVTEQFLPVKFKVSDDNVVSVSSQAQLIQ
ncbi:MAG: RNA 3'-terminal phosphate cyclase [DPANN group archaeon]|nr:RNA 3'-terminal phosphate cyclase [DPANN group archaeon]